MKRHRTIVFGLRTFPVALVAVIGFAVALPAAALAGGPLLSGYGPPGAGAQSIIGATLLNGPSNGSGGGSGGGGSAGGSGGGLSSTSAGGASAASLSDGAHRANGIVPPRERGGSGPGASRRATAGVAQRHGTARTPGASARRAGAHPGSSRLEASAAASASAVAPWFSGGDLLALALAAGLLVLVAVMTRRLAGTDHD